MKLISDNYDVEVTKSGKVFVNGGEIKPYDHQGYERVCIGGKRYFVHELVLHKFRGPRNGRITRHLNGVRDDNRLENLKWGTHKENAADMMKHGNHRPPDNRGSKHGCSKIQESDVVRIKTLLQRGEHTQKEIGAMFGVSRQTITLINTGDTWTHV